jgi:TonB family protein
MGGTSYNLNQIVQNEPTEADITVHIPRNVVNQVASVEGKIVAQPQLAAKQSSVSEDLNRELKEELKKIKQFQPVAKLNIPASKTPETTLRISGMARSNPYWARVQSIISSQWEPPPVDMTGQTYTMIVKFRLQRDGIIKDVVVQQSSGNAYFDMAGQRAVLRPRVLPPFPDDMKGAYKDLEMVFRIEESLEGHR